MNTRPVVIRKHAILKRHYRQVIDSTPHFHQLDTIGQWAVLRQRVEADATPFGAKVLTIMDSRTGRREEVLSALEQGRRDSIR